MKELLEQGLYHTQKEEAHRLAAKNELAEDYDKSRIDRDAQAVKKFCESDMFQKLVGGLD